ncbi:MAG: YidC/Oxa1 family membrane protein insertase, partial [Woeseiaceae bacterium]
FQVTTGRFIPRTLSSQCVDGVLQAEFRLLAEVGQIDVRLLAEIVKDNYRFFGLAEFYGSASFNVLDENRNLDPPINERALADGSWFTITGRYNLLGVAAPGATLAVSEDRTLLVWPPGTNADLRIIYGEKELVARQESVFEVTRYSHLWGWLAAMSKVVEKMLETIHDVTRVGWGWSIVLLAVALKILLLPVSYMTIRFQRNVSNYQRMLEPQIQEIKANYDGEQAHTRIMQAHKDLGITPFFTLKPMLGLLIQIPVLIAVFNALGEMPQLVGASFMWIDSLAYPDSVATLPFALPVLGDAINILPVLMTTVTLVSTITFRNSVAPNNVVKAQKTQLYWMAAAFFVLFYAFPAAMVWYWTATNGLQLIQQRLLKI